MDTSETYMKMCEVEEIQALRKPFGMLFNIPDKFIDGDVICADSHIYIYGYTSVTLNDWQGEQNRLIHLLNDGKWRS